MKSVFVFVILLFCSVAGSHAQVAVIAHKTVQGDTITKNQLLDFFTGDIKEWPNGELVVIKDLKEKGEVRNTFYSYLGKSPSRMKSIWLKKMLSGEGDPPESLKTEDEIIQKVATTPGAIGFISQVNINEEVKLLLVIEQ